MSFHVAFSNILRNYLPFPQPPSLPDPPIPLPNSNFLPSISIFSFILPMLYYSPHHLRSFFPLSTNDLFLVLWILQVFRIKHACTCAYTPPQSFNIKVHILVRICLSFCVCVGSLSMFSSFTGLPANFLISFFFMVE